MALFLTEDHSYAGYASAPTSATDGIARAQRAALCAWFVQVADEATAVVSLVPFYYSAATGVWVQGETQTLNATNGFAFAMNPLGDRVAVKATASASSITSVIYRFQEDL